MTVDCPRCGAAAEWVEIVGSAASPSGSVYRCEDGHKFSKLSVAPGGMA